MLGAGRPVEREPFLSRRPHFRGSVVLGLFRVGGARGARARAAHRAPRGLGLIQASAATRPPRCGFARETRASGSDSVAGLGPARSGVELLLAYQKALAAAAPKLASVFTPLANPLGTTPIALHLPLSVKEG
jgi:hypothetical protein